MPAVRTTEESRALTDKRWGKAARRALQMSDLRRDLQSGLPLSKVIGALNEAVQAGEPWAVALWLAYVCGRPTNQNEVGVKAAPTARRLTDEELLEILARHGVVEDPGQVEAAEEAPAMAEVEQERESEERETKEGPEG